MSLQKRSGGQNVFGNACGSSRKSRGKCFGVCGSSRKSRGEYFGVCAGRASTAAFTETFAQAAQVSRHLPRRLRRLRWVPRHLPRRLRNFRRDLAALQGRVDGGVCLSGGRVRPGGLRITRATCRAYAGGIVFAGVLCTDGNRVASSLTTQRIGNRVASE